MSNEKNLIPMAERTPEEVREMARKGGKASGIARRRKKSLREAADLLLSMPVKDKKTQNAMTKMGIDPDDGDAKAAKLVFDALGEEDKGGSDVVKIIDDIPTPPEEEADGK